jgi:hypothetical protein
MHNCRHRHGCQGLNQHCWQSILCSERNRTYKQNRSYLPAQNIHAASAACSCKSTTPLLKHHHHQPECLSPPSWCCTANWRPAVKEYCSSCSNCPSKELSKNVAEGDANVAGKHYSRADGASGVEGGASVGTTCSHEPDTGSVSTATT